jgi:hypothetical protein
MTNNTIILQCVKYIYPIALRKEELTSRKYMKKTGKVHFLSLPTAVAFHWYSITFVFLLYL